MHTIYTDSLLNDNTRRGLLYEGQIFSYSNRASIRTLAEFAGDMLQGGVSAP